MPKIELDREIDLEEVLRFATEKHKGQKRDDGRDYITHPIRVAKIVEKFKAGKSVNKNVLIAGALLHDTLEDTYTSYKELVDKFGDVVASLVLELTNADYCCKFIGKQSNNYRYCSFNYCYYLIDIFNNSFYPIYS